VTLFLAAPVAALLFTITNSSRRTQTSLPEPPARMRLVKRHIDNDGSGSVTLCPEEPEDMVSRTSFNLQKTF
jgi:hypothetical protein